MTRECYEYNTINGDTFDKIALDFYGEENYSTFIMQLNPDHIKTIIFDSGIKLLIPKLKINNKSSLPPWKR
ncbi:LysM domain-containing protein [Clostridium botulinum]|nr:LysM domain-containing protein [Clostridium botulinum]NFI17325.1 LysM domain-containing protein [Clostridium botulinum]NFL92098.1 LysM domain-containing protein [Clostridium botulinum]NFN52128.1 LysM domain-containing protein [Clostridium botulinum]NFO26659.1 LysM domain-containing protein [Clostridium botulinum]